MEVKIQLEENEGKQDFVDFAYRITRKGLDQQTKDLGTTFLRIIAQVLPTNMGGNDLAPERVVDSLHHFFKHNNYNVSRIRCLQILKYHKEYKLPDHGPEY